MKKHLLLIIITSIAFASKAQGYVFPTTNATWHNLFTSFTDDGSGTIEYQRMTHLTLRGDSMINSRKYYKVYSFTTDSTISKLEFLYRIDGEKVYRYFGSREVLEYDFGMEVGDTLKFSENYFFTVKKIDSIKLFDGFHKVIDFDGGKYRRFIRGIGSPVGLFRSLGENVSGFADDLACFSHKNVTLFPRYSDTTCYEIVKFPTAINEKTLSNISIYPNPVSNEIHINWGDINILKHNINIKVVDINGKIVVKEEIKQLNTLKKLNVTHLNKGIYLVVINFGKYNYYQKFVKE